MSSEYMKIKSILPNNCMHGYDKDFNINHFFFEKNCFLKEHTIDGKNCGNIVNHYCYAYNLNPRIMMITLQREMGLISMKNASDVKNFGKYDSLSGACGCGILDDGTVLSKYSGFENQISGACATYRHWYDAFKPNSQMELLDKNLKVCVPETAITMSLLKYTPHLEALKLSEKLFTEFFNGWYDPNMI